MANLSIALRKHWFHSRQGRKFIYYFSIASDNILLESDITKTGTVQINGFEENNTRFK